MPKVNVAFNMDPQHQGAKIADNSKTNLKKRLRQMPNTSWRILNYEVNGVKEICQAIEDISKLTPVDGEDVRVTESGQLRTVN